MGQKYLAKMDIMLNHCYFIAQFEYLKIKKHFIKVSEMFRITGNVYNYDRHSQYLSRFCWRWTFSEYNAESQRNTRSCRTSYLTIVELHNEKLIYRQIAERVKVPYSTVGALVRNRETGEVSNLPRVGAPRKIKGRSRRYMPRKVTNEPMTTR